MTKFRLVAYLLLCFHLAAGQSREIDSLKRDLSATEETTTRIQLLHELTIREWDFDFEKAQDHAQQANELAARINNKKGLTISLTDIGQYYYFKGNYPLASVYFKKAIATAGTENFGEYPSKSILSLGNLLRVQSKFDSALYFFTQAELRSKQLKPYQNRLVASVNDNFGLIYFDRGNYQEAINKFRKSLTIYESLKDSLLLAESWSRLSRAYAKTSRLDSAELYFKKVEQASRKLKNAGLSVAYHLYFGDYQFSKGEFQKASINYLLALDSLSVHDFVRYRAIAYKSIGQVYEWQGDYNKALKYFLNSLELNEKLNAKQEIANIHMSMGWSYVSQGNLAKAKEYQAKALQTYKEIGDVNGMAGNHTLSGTIFARENKLDSSVSQYDTAIFFRHEIGHLSGEASTINLRAIVYAKQGKETLALNDLNTVISISEKLGSKVELSRAHNQIASILLEKTSSQKVYNHILIAMQLAREIQTIPELRKSYLNLAVFYRKSNDKEKALDTYEEYINLSDSLLNAESILQQAQTNAIYELERKEDKIELLSQQNELKQNKIEIQENKINSQYTLLIFLVIGSLFLVVFAFALYKYSQSKKKANARLLALNKEVQEKSEEIQTQSEELVETNHVLSSLNEELFKKQIEIKNQGEELLASNKLINKINHELELTVQKRTEQLQQSYAELDTFFYRSSHDFRRPLTTFMGLAEVAKFTVKDPYALELFSKVKETAENLDKMLMKLQSISDTGSQHLIVKEVRVKELTFDILDSFKSEIVSKNIKTQLEVEVENSFISYPTFIKIVLENLIENSIRFSKPFYPLIKIRIVKVAGGITIVVQDNGQGIATEYQERIFDMYFRANENSKGNGLGLYIVKKAVERLQGKITFESKLHESSTFQVTIPTLPKSI